MQRFRFVHTADLHLDSPFKGLKESNQTIAARLAEATFDAYERIIDVCIDKKIDFLLIAGDIYDGADRSLRAQLKFRDGLKRLTDANINAFIAHGNHDPLDGWCATLSWPEGVHIFKKDLEIVPVERDGQVIANIHGVSHPKREVKENLAKKFHRRDKDLFSVGLLHCNVGVSTGHEPYAPCSKQDLVGAGMDYWALGHVHNGAVLRSSEPMIIYPGNPQGLHPRESGGRGCYVVEVNEAGIPSAEFVAVDQVRWVIEEVSIAGVVDEESLLVALDERCDAVRKSTDGRPVVLRIILKDRGPVHHTIKRPDILTDLEDRLRETQGAEDPFVWVERLETRTRADVNVETRREADDFLGDLLKLVHYYQNDSGASKQLCKELELLYQSPSARKLLHMPDQEALLEVLSQVETLFLDRMMEEE